MPQSRRRLCDDDGIVGESLAEPQPLGDDFLTYRGLHNRLAALSGREPLAEDFACTGSAHYAGQHIKCTSPAHEDDDQPMATRPGQSSHGPTVHTPHRVHC